MEAHKKDGARLLELNKISVEDVKDRQTRLAKMRSLLFRHEMKARRIKKIKSKTYHRLLKKDRSKALEAEIQLDPEVAKDLAMKQEFKRAEERMTLKHQNSSKWAKRILKRGLDVQDEGTRAAIAEQLHQHATLTRKMKSMKDSSSSDESSDEDDIEEISSGSDQDIASKLFMKAKEKTLEVLEGDEEVPKSGVLSLPFMVRGLKKRKEAADEEARLALEDYESSLKQLEGKGGEQSHDRVAISGRRVQEISKKVKIDNYYGDSDSEIDVKTKEGEEREQGKGKLSVREVNIDPDFLREESEISHDPVFKNFEDILKVPGPNSNYEVAIFASDSWKNKQNLSDGNEQKKATNNNVGKSSVPARPSKYDQIIESTYDFPSQEELIRRAFAGDDVEEEFEKDKEAILNEENPEIEKPVLLPGWGQWTDIQKKKGLPSWMQQEHDMAKKKREEALKKRKDAHLNNVIISEKLDKKAEKLHTKTLPYPYTSKEVFEQSIRMPIGPEFNPVTAVGALNRPEVVKRAGVSIKPIQFQDVNPHEKVENHKRKGQKPSNGKDKSRSTKKMNVKEIKAK
ncbi:Uncharacterized protein C57A7.06 [Olea europaea subsp. europaea]|uniref:Uncharacterized protein C57A7.06 n=1 Tax=Olea europaea subsp. europaea TaxID=158383 RepID=A0A8S0P835_OLEEU|nr:Uncharacterized protein C57A7.06 [Olea europaea subsp. europaea]